MATEAVQLYLPEPLEHQTLAYYSPARFKILRCGRRWGKDRVAFTSAIAGHGPDTDDGPMLRGAMHQNPRTGTGFWIGWLVRDYPQAVGLWEEEFLPRFSALKPLVKTNKSEMSIYLPNGGGVRMCTAENIDSMRGIGKGLGGIVVNEAAHMNLKYAWERVINWILVDNEGWAIVMSTTNSGKDGNAEGITPSYFNRLCQKVRSGNASDAWEEFTGTGDDNPALSAEAIREARSIFVPGTREEREEWFAELMPTGGGLAFPMWDTKVHSIDWHDPPPEHALVLGMDWAISADNLAAVVACRVGPDRTVIAFREWTWTGKDAYDAGADFARSLLMAGLPRWPDWMVADSAMNERTGVGGTTILSEFQGGVDSVLKPLNTPGLSIMPAPKGPGSRKAMYNQITKLLAWGPAMADGTVPATRMPLFQIMRDRAGNTSCPTLQADLATSPKVDGEDDVDKSHALFAAGDAFGYLLSIALPQADTPPKSLPVDRHPGWVVPGVRRDRDRSPDVVAKETELQLRYLAEREGEKVGGRYGRPMRPRRR